MSAINDGGAAFHSITCINGDNYNPARLQYHRGMSLRDWFAGQSLDLASKLEHDHPTGSEGQPTYAGIAKRAYYMADAMLVERRQP